MLSTLDQMLSTKKPEKIYNFIVNASKLHAELFLKKKLNIKLFNISSFPNIKFLIFFLLFVFSGRIFFKEQRLNVNYLNVNIGRFILASVFANFKCYIYKSSYIYNYLKYFYIAGKFINTAQVLLKKNNFNCIYIDHCGGINGILFSLLVKKKIIYTNNYPRNIFVSHAGYSYDSIKYEDFLKINKNKKYINGKSKRNAAKLLRKLSKSPEVIPWMSGTCFTNLKKIKNIKDYEYIIYTHSFTDGQLWFGNDGFQNSLDWLVFTLDYLKKEKKKTIIKCHPNYFNKDFGEVSDWDRKIFYKIHKKYQECKNFYFILDSIKNNELTRNLNKRCIAITHHGNIVMEMGFLGFKVISSQACFYSKDFKISNIWNNKEEYLAQLSKKYNELKKCNVSDLYQLVNELFFDRSSYYGNKSIIGIIKKFIGIKITKQVFKNNKVNLNSNYFDKISQYKNKKIIKTLAENIDF
jgi:hypothetical protein